MWMYHSHSGEIADVYAGLAINGFVYGNGPTPPAPSTAAS